MKVKIYSTKEYNDVLKRIDELLDLTFLSDHQTSLLKGLLDAVDEYQLLLFKNQLPAQCKVVNNFLKNEQILMN